MLNVISHVMFSLVIIKRFLKYGYAMQLSFNKLLYHILLYKFYWNRHTEKSSLTVRKFCCLSKLKFTHHPKLMRLHECNSKNSFSFNFRENHRYSRKLSLFMKQREFQDVRNIKISKFWHPIRPDYAIVFLKFWFEGFFNSKFSKNITI